MSTIKMSPVDSAPPSISTDLNTFIYGVSRRNFQNAPELTKIAVTLLRTFPAARDAVLDYFSMVFQDAMNTCMNQPEYENEGSIGPSMEAVHIIAPALCNLDEAWSPIVAPWCISLLKDIAGTKTNFANTTVQSSDPVRALLNIATVSLTRLNEQERANCIDMMLGSSQCDWVIGHVGRCDPSLVVPRALQLGIQNDSHHNIDHVVGILTHLSPLHFNHIRKALLNLFNECLNPDSKTDRKKEIIPYLLHLASKSDTVLMALTKDFESLLSDSVVEHLTAICSSMKGNPSWDSVTPALLVSLCLRSEATTFNFLLSWANKNVFCRELLEHLLQKIEFEARNSNSTIPLLKSITDEISTVRYRLIGGSLLDQYSVARVLILVGYHSTAEFVNTVSYILKYSQNERTLALLVRIISGTLIMRASMENNEHDINEERSLGLIKEAIDNALRDSIVADGTMKRSLIAFNDGVPVQTDTYLQRFCKNITTLLRWESTNRVMLLKSKPISRACQANLFKLSTVFEEKVSLLQSRQFNKEENPMPTCHAIANMLDRIDLSNSGGSEITVDVTMKMVQAVVKYFFRCLHEKDTIHKMLGTQTAYSILRKLCAGSKTARAVGLRELLEGALFRETDMFGGRGREGAQNNEDYELTKDELLMFQNQKHGPITQLTQSHTSVFHAGIIGKGARRAASDTNGNGFPKRNTKEIELLMGALTACMEESGGVIDGMTSVSLLLIELISPDVMYNGLPWPDEDFTKVSIERELYMRCAVEGCPAARAALRRAAAARPALCYASALLRAVAATLMHQQAANADRFIGMDSINLNSVTKELLETMCLGQLLPHPLNYIMEMLPSLKPNEIVQILRDCIWNYTRDHVPSPALFTCDSNGVHWRDPTSCRPPPAYTDTLRTTIQRNIASLGHLYPIMFLRLSHTAQNE